jgi:hypothetical protein
MVYVAKALLVALVAIRAADWKLPLRVEDFRERALRTLAYFGLIYVALELITGFSRYLHRGWQGGEGEFPHFPNSPSDYFAWAVVLILFIIAVWLEVRPAAMSRIRLKKLRASKNADWEPRP